MFNIFKKKAKTNALQDVFVVEKQEAPVVENIASLLVIAMTEYLKDAEQKSRVAVPVITDIRKQYDRLLSLGMGTTQNAISLKQHIDEADRIENDLRKAHELIGFVKAVHSELSEKSVLVSNGQFEDICKRYRLQIASLSNYCGVIPEKNIQDVEKVKENIERFSIAKLLNKAEHGYMLFVNKANLHSNDFEVLSSYLKQHNYIITVGRDTTNSDSCWWGEDITDINLHLIHGALSKLYGKIMTSSDMFIACPKEYISNPEIKISKRPVDSMIFQYTPYGVLVYTIWGKEAEDAVLRQYLELNTRIIKNMDKTELVDLMLKDIEKMTKANEDALQYHNVRTILNYGDYNFDDYANGRSNQSPA